MGYYIEVPKNQGKAKQISLMYDGEIIEKPKNFSDIPSNKAIICVVDNGLFEAVGFCYSEKEFLVFSNSMDRRPKQWLLLDLVLTKKLTRYIENES